MTTAREEWRRMWPLPFVAMIGMVGAPAFGYAAGVLSEPVSKAFGWSRTEFYSALSLQLMAAIFIVPAIGYLVDRVGSRRVALVGCITHMIALSCFGLANGSLWQWWLLCGLSILGGAACTQPVWVRPVASNFKRARGMAIAIALSGNGIATTIWPIIAALWVDEIGWRWTFPALALTWGIIALPLTLLFFRDQGGSRAPVAVPADQVPLPPLAPVLGSSRFIFLTLSGAFLSFATFGFSVHFVPMMRSHGIDLATAAGVAGTIGIFSIVGRIGTGALLDRLTTAPVAVTVFSLPVLAALILLFGGNSLLTFGIAGALIGLGAGAEIDVITFVAARRFDARIFGSIYATAIAVFSVLAALGPLAASKIFDATGSYHGFLAAAAAISIVATFMIGRVAAGLAPPATSGRAVAKES